MSPTTDVMSLPRSLWGKVSKDVAGWGLSVRADVEFDDPSLIDFDVRASNSDFGSYKMLASTGPSFRLHVGFTYSTFLSFFSKNEF